ncbi:MAG: phage head closure protein [Planctomycetaceae bacterium]|nr:phage head closure protein [Planctomycetaceae bacterium]
MAQRGKYRTKVTVQQPAETAAADGQLVPSWSTYATPWAKVQAINGEEEFQDKQSKATLTHVVRVRANSTTRAITPQMRIQLGSRLLYIHTVNDEDERHIDIVMECEERVQ